MLGIETLLSWMLRVGGRIEWLVGRNRESPFRHRRVRLLSKVSGQPVSQAAAAYEPDNLAVAVLSSDVFVTVSKLARSCV